jgi:pantoate--beta-alanine ligase
LVSLVLEKVRPVATVQYCEVVDLQGLHSLQGELDRPAALALAVFVGSVRLIDNVILAAGTEGES